MTVTIQYYKLNCGIASHYCRQEVGKLT